MPYKIFTDGGSRSRHGGDKDAGAAWAFVALTPKHGKKKFSGFLETATNNEAEYQAVIEALRWLLTQNVTTQVTIKSDSELIVKQLKGEYQVKNPSLAPYWETAYSLLLELQETAASVQLVHIKRSSEPENVEADELCNAEMDAAVSSTIADELTDGA